MYFKTQEMNLEAFFDIEEQYVLDCSWLPGVGGS